MGNWQENLCVLAHIFSPRRTIYEGLIKRPVKGQYELLDFVRAWSVIWLVVFHAWWTLDYHPKRVVNGTNILFETETLWWTGMAMQGSLSVDCFLLISGFLIGLIIAKEQAKYNRRVNLKRFCFRRCVRIYPLLIVILIAYTVLTMDPGCTENWYATLLFFNNIPPIISHFDTCMGWTWSLSLEMQFYLIAALLLGALWRHPKYQRYASWMIVFGSWVCRFVIALLNDMQFPPVPLEYTGAIWTETLYIPPWTRIGSLFIGVLCALYYQQAPKPYPNTRPILRIFFLLASVGVVFLIIFPNWWEILDERCLVSEDLRFSWNCGNSKLSPVASALALASFRYLFTAGSGVLLFFGLIKCRDNETHPCWMRMMMHHFWYVIAQLSYGIYMINGMVAVGITQFEFPLVTDFAYSWAEDDNHKNLGWFLLLVLVVFVLTSILSFLCYIFVEKPFMDLREFSKIKTKLREKYQVKDEDEDVEKKGEDKELPVDAILGNDTSTGHLERISFDDVSDASSASSRAKCNGSPVSV